MGSSASYKNNGNGGWVERKNFILMWKSPRDEPPAWL